MPEKKEKDEIHKGKKTINKSIPEQKNQKLFRIQGTELEKGRDEDCS